MTIRRLLTALTTTALLTGAMLGAPKATSALSAYNSIAVDYHAVFMKNLSGLAVGDQFLSAYGDSIHEVTSITAGSLDCYGFCDDEGFFLPEGTRGWIVIFDGPVIYGMYTEDTLTAIGLNVTVWNVQDGAIDYENWSPWNSNPPNRSNSTVCANKVNTGTLDPTVGININFVYDLGCNHDDVVAHYVGFITPTFSGEIQFCDSSDDGMYVKIGESVVIDNWILQGASRCNSFGAYTFVAGVPAPFDLWWFENAGGEFSSLKYYTDGHYVDVPKAWFTPGRGTDCGNLDATVCPTIEDGDTGSVIGAPGTSYTTTKTTYTWLRCRTEGAGQESRTALLGCRIIKKTSGYASSMVRSPYRVSTTDRTWGYLRLSVREGNRTYYSGTYALNQ